MTLSQVPSPSADEVKREGGDGEGWLARLARFAGRRRRLVMLAWLVTVVAAAPLALRLSSALSGAGWEAQGSTAQTVRDELRRDFPQPGAEAAVVAYHQAEPIAASPAGLQALVGSLRGAPGAAAVVDPLALPPDAGLISPDGRTALDSRRAGCREGRRPAGVGSTPHRPRPIAPAAVRCDGRGDRGVGGVERLQRRERARLAPRRAPVRPADVDPAVHRLRVGRRRRHPVAARGGGHLRRMGGAQPAQRDDSAVGVVDELLDDDRAGRRDRLQPLHRLPLPGRTRRRLHPTRRDRQHIGHRRQGRLPVGLDRRRVAGGDLPRAGDGVPLDGAGHDPRRRRHRRGLPHPAAGGARRPR